MSERNYDNPYIRNGHVPLTDNMDCPPLAWERYRVSVSDTVHISPLSVDLGITATGSMGAALFFHLGQQADAEPSSDVGKTVSYSPSASKSWLPDNLSPLASITAIETFDAFAGTTSYDEELDCLTEAFRKFKDAVIDEYETERRADRDEFD